MLKIDFEKFVYDRVWFGCYIDGRIDQDWIWHIGRGMDWADRLYPVRRYGVPFAHWWFILWRIPLEPLENDD